MKTKEDIQREIDIAEATLTLQTDLSEQIYAETPGSKGESWSAAGLVVFLTSLSALAATIGATVVFTNSAAL